MDDVIKRQSVLDSFKRICDNYCEDKKHGLAMCRSCYLDDAISIVENLSSAQLDSAIPLSWIEEHIEWLKSLDNEFANLTAIQISSMVKKWRGEQDE